jgi:phosphoglucosamine mutase
VVGRLARVAGTLGTSPDGRNINAGVGSTHLTAVAAAVRERGAACGLAFDGDADRCLAVDPAGRPVNGDAIIAAIALARGVDRVVVTSMTNLGFHRVMRRHGVAVEVTDVGDRYVLAGMLATGATLGGEQSGHVVDLEHHTTGDGLATALMLLAALARLEMSMADLADLVVPFPQRLVAVPADRAALGASARIWKEISEAEAKLGHDGRIVVRASGTEPVVRVMVEAEDAALCDDLCNHLVGIVQEEIGVG